MPVSQQQLQYLNAMGIELWQRKAIAEEQPTASEKQLINIDKSTIEDSSLFSDILKALGISPAEVSYKTKHLDLGLFNWRFTAEESDDLSFVANQITSPAFEDISQKPALKRQLWQLIQQHELAS